MCFVDERKSARRKLWEYLEGPWFWGGMGLLLGAVAANVSLRRIFIIGFIPMAIGILCKRLFDGKVWWKRAIGNVLVLVLMAGLLFGGWKVSPKPKELEEPPTLQEIVDAVGRKLGFPQQPSQATSKKEPPKPPTAAEIADAVVALLQEDQELSQRESELAKQIRKIESDHQRAIQSIEKRCTNSRGQRFQPCGLGMEAEEDRTYRKARDGYLGEAVNLRGAILDKLPPQPLPQPDMERLDGLALADYLDALAAKLNQFQPSLGKPAHFIGFPKTL